MSANDRQVGGDHYKTGGIELWDLFGPESIIFYALRYLQRWQKKNGKEDLEKALHCVQKLREVAPRFSASAEKKILSGGLLQVSNDMFEAWMRNSGMGPVEQDVCRRLVLSWHLGDYDLMLAEAGIDYMRQRASLARVSWDKMTDDELRAELAELEKAQSEATGWGAAVGARHEAIQSIERILHRREQKRNQREIQNNDRQRVERLTTLGPVPGDEVPAVLSKGEYTKDSKYNWYLVRVLNGDFAPWVADRNWFKDKGVIRADLVAAFWKQRSPTLYVLEPFVPGRDVLLPDQLQWIFMPVELGWRLNIKSCPPEVRSYFPSLPLHVNQTELDALEPWQRDAYSWNGVKWSLELSEWHYEEDEDGDVRETGT